MTESAEPITVLALSGYQHGAAGWECAEGSLPRFTISSMPVSQVASSRLTFLSRRFVSALPDWGTFARTLVAAGYFGSAVRSCTTDVNCEREVALSGTFRGGDVRCVL